MPSVIPYFSAKYQEVASDEETTNLDPGQKQHRYTNAIQYLVIAVLSLGWLTTSIYLYQTQKHTNGTPSAFISSPIPPEVFKPTRKTFNPDKRYVGDSTDVDHQWDALVAGHDALWIENPTSWGLPEGIVAPYDHPNTPNPKPQDFYVVSILHQLHCLNIVRFQYYQEKNRAMVSVDSEAFKWKVHVEHCFEYLRQGISCGGNLVIEGNSPIKVSKGHATSVTGWGVEHWCIDFEALRRFQIQQEAKYNSTWQVDT